MGPPHPVSLLLLMLDEVLALALAACHFVVAGVDIDVLAHTRPPTGLEANHVPRVGIGDCAGAASCSTRRACRGYRFTPTRQDDGPQSLATTVGGSLNSGGLRGRSRGLSACGVRCDADGHHLQQAGQSLEIAGILRIERKPRGNGRRGDEQINGSPAARLSARRGDSRVHQTVCTGNIRVDRQGVEGRFGTLKAILATGSFGAVPGGVWSGGKLGHRDDRDRELVRQVVRVDQFEIDDDGRVDNAARMPGRRHRSDTRRGILVDRRVHVLPESRAGDARRTGKGRDGRLGRDERTLPHGDQIAHRYAVARHGERPALVEGSHDASALVPEFALGDAAVHQGRS